MVEWTEEQINFCYQMAYASASFANYITYINDNYVTGMTNLPQSNKDIGLVFGYLFIANILHVICFCSAGTAITIDAAITANGWIVLLAVLIIPGKYWRVVSALHKSRCFDKRASPIPIGVQFWSEILVIVMFNVIVAVQQFILPTDYRPYIRQIYFANLMTCAWFSTLFAGRWTSIITQTLKEMKSKLLNTAKGDEDERAKLVVKANVFTAKSELFISCCLFPFIVLTYVCIITGNVMLGCLGVFVARSVVVPRLVLSNNVMAFVKTVIQTMPSNGTTTAGTTTQHTRSTFGNPSTETKKSAPQLKGVDGNQHNHAEIV